MTRTIEQAIEFAPTLEQLQVMVKYAQQYPDYDLWLKYEPLAKYPLDGLSAILTHPVFPTQYVAVLSEYGATLHKEGKAIPQIYSDQPIIDRNKK
jgi:hypothetical protein